MQKQNTMLNLNDIRLFLKVAHTGSLSRAATLLDVPKSNISRRLQALEDDLGFRLFNRISNRLVLTQQGQELVRQYQDVFTTLEHKERLLSDIGHSLTGRLKVSIPSDLVNTHFNNSLADFKLRFPDIDLECYVSSKYNEFAIADYDVALLINSHQLPDGDYVARRLFDVQSSLYVSPTFCADLEQPLRLDQLNEHPHISHTFDQQWALSVQGKTESILLNSAIKIDSILAQRTMASAGLGIARLPDFFCRDATTQGSLRVLNVDGLCQPYQVCIAYADRHLQPRSVEVFIDYYRQQAVDMSL